MGETQHQQQQLSRLGLKSTRAGTGAGGQIVEVQGGHVVRSTGRKDRHSKVCTAKGPRDRRVRLSAHTAIQFYDVQDRLGYDRPSKAVDWLIKKAKAAIDELAELPPWHPTANTSQLEQTREAEIDSAIVGSSKRAMGLAPLPVPTLAPLSGYAFQPHQELNNSNSSSFLPPSLDSDAIADTIKSFFPMGAATSSSSPIHFRNYPHEPVSRTSSHAQDLRLSLQSSQDPILLHHHHFTPSSSAEQPFFSSWSGQQQVSPEISRFQRMVAWNAATEPASEVGFHFNSPPPLQQALLGQNPLFYQRGTLQSSNSPSVRAWIDPLASTTADHHYTPVGHPSSISSIGFASVGGSGFRIPARIQGEEEQQDAVSSKPSSASHH